MTLTCSSHGLWRATAPPAPETRPLAVDTAAEVVIIGGGYTGCSAALHLAEAGCRVILLDAREVGFGGAGRNVGLVNAGLWVMPDEVLRVLGGHHGELLLRQLGKAPSLVFDIVERYGIGCEAVRNGTLHCAVGRGGLAEITRRAAQWQARGADVALLDAGQARDLTGTDAYAGALLDRRAGTIQPLAYARGLAAAAIKAGAGIHTGSPVIAREPSGEGWRVRTEAGSVTAPWVLITTDAYSQAATRDVAREQVMLPYFNMATAPLPPELRRTILPGLQGCWDTRQILSSFRYDQAGRLVFGSVGALRAGGAEIHRQWSRRTLARLFPQLCGIRFEHEWYGQIGMTGDAMPRLHVHDRCCLSISGYNGRGIAPGTSFGRDLADIVLGRKGVEEMALPVTGMTFAPLRTLRAAFYEAGAQLAHFAADRIDTGAGRHGQEKESFDG